MKRFLAADGRPMRGPGSALRISPMFNPMLLGSGAAGGLLGSFKSSASASPGGTSNTFVAMVVGTAAANRLLVATVSSQRAAGGVYTINSVTIGGVAATQVGQIDNGLSTACTAIFAAVVPTGAAINVDVVWSLATAFAAVGLYALYGANATATSVQTDSGLKATASVAINCSAGGMVIGACEFNNDAYTNETWTGLTRDFAAADGASIVCSSAALTTAVALTGLAVTSTSVGPVTVPRTSMVVAAFAPA